MENDSGKRRIHLFCTLFCVIIVAVPLKESLPGSKILCSAMISHIRGGISGFPAEFMDKTDVMHNLHDTVSSFLLVPAM